MARDKGCLAERGAALSLAPNRELGRRGLFLCLLVGNGQSDLPSGDPPN